jgi:hypothetical protein
MSDIQDLIHKTSMDCIERGKVVERERIVKLLEKKLFHTVYNDGEYPAVVNQQHFGGDVIQLIKGETNG